MPAAINPLNADHKAAIRTVLQQCPAVDEYYRALQQIPGIDPSEAMAQWEQIKGFCQSVKQQFMSDES